MSPDLILTHNRHVLPVPWVADWITGPCLKACPTDGFSPLITENFQNTRKDINIKHVTLEIIKIVGRPTHKFCKQKISDSPEPRIILTNVSTLPLRYLMLYLFTKWSGATRSFWKKIIKKSNKTGCNQNMPAVPLFRWSVELKDIKFFPSCSVKRIRVFLLSNQSILLRLVS